MYTIVDVGSNTVRMNVYDVKYDRLKLLFSKKETVGLASYVKDKKMTDAGIERVINVLLEFQDILHNLNIYEMHVFATAALRNVKNSQEAIAAITSRTGIDIQVLSGREEAELDFQGATIASNVKKGLLVDIGGGSTELVSYKGRLVMNAISIPKGSLNSYNQYVSSIIPTKEERKAIKQDFMSRLDGLKGFERDNKYKLICGVGGTTRAALKLDKLLFGEDSAENILPVSHIGYIIKTLENKSSKDKLVKNLNTLMDVVPERTRTILPGLIILYAIAKRFKSEAVIVTNTGVREGFMYNYVLKDDKTDENVHEEENPEFLEEGTESEEPGKCQEDEGRE